MCKLHGDRLIKGIKIYESMLKKTKSTVTSKKTAKVSSQHQLNWCRIIMQTCTSVWWQDITNKIASNLLKLKVKYAVTCF